MSFEKYSYELNSFKAKNGEVTFIEGGIVLALVELARPSPNTRRKRTQ